MENGDAVVDEPLAAGVAKRPIFVPEFNDAECRLDTIFDSEADVTLKGRALTGGRPPLSTSDTSSIVDDAIEEETIEAVTFSPAHVSRENGISVVEEESLVSSRVNRSLNLENLYDLLNQQNNSRNNYSNPNTKHEVHESDSCIKSDASFAFASPQYNAGADGDAMSADGTTITSHPENISYQSIGHSEVVDRIVQPSQEFGACSNQVNDDDDILRPVMLHRKQIDLDICSDIPLHKLSQVPEAKIETDSIEEEGEIIECVEASVAHSAVPGGYEAENKSVSEDEFTAVEIPRRSLDDSILKNELFTFVSLENRQPNRVITESDEEEMASNTEQQAAARGGVNQPHTSEVIVPQRSVSTKFSAGVAVKSTSPPVSPSVSTTGNNTTLVDSKADDRPTEKVSPKTKSKGFLGIFRHSPKSAHEDKKENKNNEKSKSLPRNLTVTAASAEGVQVDKKSPSPGNKKSGFFSFGSRGKGKVSKSTNSDKPASTSASITTKPSPELKPPSVSGKSNIRVFEIMAENGAAKPKDPSSNVSVPDVVEQSKVARHDPAVTASVAQPGQASTHYSTGTDYGFITANVENLEQLKTPEVSVNQPNVINQNIAKPSTENSLSKYMVVVAIDFGTAFSGYAFSFVRDPESVHMMSRWEGGDPGLINQKTPSTLLLDPEGRFHSFGFTARNHYHDLSPEDALQWLYFDKFKMSLYNNSSCNRQTVIEAANGRKFPAMEAVRMTLSFFKDHALQELSEQCGTQMTNDDVRWIITVPAIWNAAAKQFMREAAYDAGLASPNNPDQLVVALEPEAASIHIRKLRLHQLVPEKPTATLPLFIRKLPQGPVSLETVSSQFKTVTRYMVVDCGGGTVDLTVHDLNAVSGSLTEVYKATGGAHGSTGIDSDFESLLSAIFGEDFIKSYRQNKPSGWVALMTAFESRKRAANPFRIRQPMNVALPFSFIDYHRKMKGFTVEKAISDFGEAEVRWSSQGMLRLSYEAMKVLFQTTVDGIIRSVTEVFSKVSGIRDIFLVGGLSESPIIQQAIRDKFGLQARVVVPQEANLAVLKGAVGFGLDPGVVTERRAMLTYGAAVLHRFIPGKHPTQKLIHRDGVDWCKDVFDQFVVVNQVVRREEPVVRSYTPASPNQPHITINIYCTEHSDVEYVTDSRVRQCATVTLNLTRNGTSTYGSARRKIQTFMSFAETEIKVTALDTITGEKVDTTIDFCSK